MKPTASEEIYVTKALLPPLEEYIREISGIWNSYILTNSGDLYKKLQHRMIRYLDVKYLSLFVNGHAALELGLQAMGLHGEVITTPFTFISTTHAIARSGLQPVFCDIDRESYTMDPDRIESLITERTSAIMPVHVYGNACDVDAIGEIAKRHHLKVIYDAAHAFGVQYQGKGIGQYGDMSMFSFHATKVFNTIEGGAVTFSDERYRKTLHIIKNFGIAGPETVEGIGANAKLDEFRAAMGICNLRHVEENIRERRRVHERYVEKLSCIDGVKLMRYREGVEPNYAYFPVYFDRNVLGFDRDDVFNRLAEHGIHARKYFYPLSNSLEAYRQCGGDTPVAEDVAGNILTLPIYADIGMERVDQICELIEGMV